MGQGNNMNFKSGKGGMDQTGGILGMGRNENEILLRSIGCQTLMRESEAQTHPCRLPVDPSKIRVDGEFTEILELKDFSYGNGLPVDMYSIELITAQTKTLISTRQIPVNTVLFYLTNDSEKFPFTLVESTKEAMILEIPEFFYKSPNKPELLERSRYVFKTENGLTYNFISRTMRYEENKDTGKILMLVAHTENLATQMHRHFRREMFDDQCFFSSVKKGTDKKEKYIVSEKKYEGQLSNISGGGCCIKTDLPVKENQLIAMDFPKIQVKEQVIGIIKRTRKLPTGTFALHIQFLDISLESQNMIMAYVYKYEL